MWLDLERMTTSAAEDWVPELTFPARLAVVRNRMGWNAKEAALACGLPAQSWRNWEAGKRPQDYEAICKKIHERTGCNLPWLMGSVTAAYPWPLDDFSHRFAA